MELIPLYGLLKSQDLMQVLHNWDEVLIKKTLLVGFFSNFESSCPSIGYLHPYGELILLDMLDTLVDQH